jgi:cytochrome P450
VEVHRQRRRGLLEQHALTSRQLARLEPLVRVLPAQVLLELQVGQHRTFLLRPVHLGHAYTLGHVLW